MAVTFVGAGALAGNATVATQAISCHASTLTDDILICQLINKSVTANAFTPPDGTWSAVITTEVNDCTTAADDHQYGLYWKRATAGGAQSFTFTKATDDNVLFAGVISAWRGALTSGSPLDATVAVRTETAGAADNVTFPAFDPTSTVAHVIYMAYYGNDLTTFAAAMSADTNPDCTKQYDLETGTGNDASLACTSGDSDGTAIASRTWASASTADAGNTGVVFALVAQPAADALLANDVASASSVTAPAIGQTHVILANDVASASSVSVPAVGQVHALLANDVASASSVSVPAVAIISPLLADDVASASSVSAPAIGQIHALNASGVASASSVTAPAVGQVHGLAADDVSSASSVSVPAVGQEHALLANGVASASSVSAPALAEVAGAANLLADDIISASSVSSPALGQVHALLANDVASASGLSSPALGGVGAVEAVGHGGSGGDPSSYFYHLLAKKERERREARERLERERQERAEPKKVKKAKPAKSGDSLDELGLRGTVSPAAIAAEQLRAEQAALAIIADVEMRRRDDEEAALVLLLLA